MAPGPMKERVVVPTQTQLYAYRSLIDMLVDDNSEAINSGTLFSARDISRETEAVRGRWGKAHGARGGGVGGARRHLRSAACSMPRVSVSALSRCQCRGCFGRRAHAALSLRRRRDCIVQLVDPAG